jgi:hypothetical protein
VRPRRDALLALLALLLTTSSSSATEPRKASETRAPWPRPELLLRAVFDPPFGPGVGATVFLTDAWSANVELLQRGAFGPVVELGAHFWPPITRGARHQLGLGLGADVLMSPRESSGGFAALVMESVDIHYLARPERHVGFVIGGKMGLGVSFEARDFGEHARGGSPLDHLGFQITSYVGVSLGAPAEKAFPGLLRGPGRRSEPLDVCLYASRFLP